MKIGYFTNTYARASDTFIRGEVDCLRNENVEISTFALNRFDAEATDQNTKQHQAQTSYFKTAWLRNTFLGLSFVVTSRPRLAFQTMAMAFRMAQSSPRSLIWHLAYFIEACWLCRELERAECQHLHAHYGDNPATIAKLAAKLSRIGYSLTIHGPYEFDKAELLSLREKVAGAAFVVCISHWTRSQLLRYVDLRDWEKVKMVRCGIGANFLEHDNHEDYPPKCFVCIGRLAPEKGHAVLIEALALMKARQNNLGISVKLIGDGPLAGELRNLATRLGVAHNIDFLGWQSPAAIRIAILQSRALVLPSFAEGLPIVIMEAFALRRPVIASATAGIPELVRDGHNGWLVPPSDPASLAMALGQCIDTDDASLARLGQHGRQAVKEHHDGRDQAKILHELFVTTLS